MKHILSIFFVFVFLCNLLNSQTKYTVSHFTSQADSIASEHLYQPTLRVIQSNDVDSTGKSEFWIFKYDSLEIYLSKDSIDYKLLNYIFTGASTMDSGWFDSDSALIIAENSGGKNFRLKYPECKISADLGKSSASIYTTWEIWYYLDHTKSIYFQIGFNALTGEIQYQYNTKVNENELPCFNQLFQNYPNPFNAITNIKYSIKVPSPVSFTIYDITGRELLGIRVGFQIAGSHILSFDFNNLASGLYFYQIRAGDFIERKKLILQK